MLASSELITQYIRGMRHHLIHEYFGASLEIIWASARDDVPALTTKLRQILDDQD
jgi:uncharacterized protein with HEPN domain